jgi:hypothetical protein
MKDEKILLELEGLKKSKSNSLEISADMNDALVKLISQNIKIRNANKENKNRKLRSILFAGRRDS